MKNKEKKFNKSYLKYKYNINFLKRMADYDYLFKMVLVGNSSVGKTCLFLQYSDNVFNDSFMPTIGVDFRIKTLEIDGSFIKMQIWDTAGQERFRTITSSYYKGAHGLILVFDLTDRQSFLDLENWIIEIEKHASDGVLKLLIGNKNDLEGARTVSYEEALNFAKINGMKYIETSAKTSKNVNEAFNLMAKLVKDAVGQSVNIENNHTPTPGEDSKPIKMKEGVKINDNKCCLTK